MSLRGKMIKMKMSDGAEIGVYHVDPVAPSGTTSAAG